MILSSAINNPLAAYLAGNADKDQQELVEQWIDESEENKDVFERLKMVWNKQDKAETPHLPVAFGSYYSNEEEA